MSLTIQLIVTETETYSHDQISLCNQRCNKI